MSIIDRIRSYQEELVAIRRDLHAHPELGFDEERTSGIVAERLAEWGVESIVGLGENRSRRRSPIGQRKRAGGSDFAPTWMRCRSRRPPGLPMRRKTRDACMPAAMTATRRCCSAPRATCRNGNFKGTVHLYLPARRGGLRRRCAMIEDGLFRQFPCDEIYGLHNSPDGPRGQFTIKPGPAMAAADFFDIRIQGQGAHGAYPHNCR